VFNRPSHLAKQTPRARAIVLFLFHLKMIVTAARSIHRCEPCFLRFAAVSPPLLAAEPRGRAKKTWRGQRVSASNERESSSSSSSSSYSYSDYSETSSFVKTVVSGMTNVANGLRKKSNDSDDASSPLRFDNPAKTKTELSNRIADEFRVKEYLWTGDIDCDLFSLACTFTDPTLSFTGLRTFRENLESLQPSLRRIAPEGKRRVELRACGVLADSDVVVAKWRMVGNLQLPWQPKIDIEGETRFQFRREFVDDDMNVTDESSCSSRSSRSSDGDEDEAKQTCLRVVSYRETWSTSASDALWQLVRPFAHEK
jgi:hypothetical protein